MTPMNDYILEYADLCRKEKVLFLKMNDLLIGKTATIRAKVFRDQPYGSSKPNLSGKSFVIERVFPYSEKLYLQLKGVRLSVEYNKVEIVS